MSLWLLRNHKIYWSYPYAVKLSGVYYAGHAMRSTLNYLFRLLKTDK